MKKWTWWFAAAAGSCDALTGALLVAAPLFTLRLMGIDAFPAEPVYTRFIGIFVLAAGLSYFLPLAAPHPAARRTLLAAVFAVLALVRVCVAVFVAGAVAAGGLTPAWLSVSATDLVIAAVQVYALASGGWREVTGR